MSQLPTINRTPMCANGWPYTGLDRFPHPRLDHYNGGCFCGQPAGHVGPCRCPFCGSTNEATNARPNPGGSPKP